MKTSLIAILAAMITVPAHAAAADEPIAAPKPGDSGQKDNDLLPEIVVTAQLRQQSLKDVPISVAVVSGKILSDYNIRDLAQARQFIPNLEYENGAEGAAIIMRGLAITGARISASTLRSARSSTEYIMGGSTSPDWLSSTSDASKSFVVPKVLCSG